MIPIANAEAPKSRTIAGLRLGDTPAAIVEWLKANYSQCRPQRSVYHALPGEATGPLAIVAINEGTMEVCEGTPEGSDSTDVIVVRFAHPSIVADRGVFEILTERQYPDPLLSAKKQVRYPLDKVMANLRKQYGRPTEERRERHAATPANPGAPAGAAVTREDQTIRLLWASKGKLPEGEGQGQGAAHAHGHVECDCGDTYVIAEIEATRSRATRPANQQYVTRLSVFGVQADVRRRQEVWNAQWLKLEPAPQPSPPTPPPPRNIAPSS